MAQTPDPSEPDFLDISTFEVSFDLYLPGCYHGKIAPMTPIRAIWLGV